MYKYTILCTEEQTIKSFALGAPIEDYCGLVPTAYIDGGIYDIPTAEQMIGWMTEQGLAFNTEWSWGGRVTIRVWDNHNHKLVYTSNAYSLKECTLAAIDAALDYLV